MSTKQIDVVFLNANVAQGIFQKLSDEVKAIEPPIWSGLLANGLRRNGHSVAILDAEALALTVPQTVDELSNLRPRLVVVSVYGQQPSASTQNMASTRVVLKAIEEAGRGYKVIMIGTHPSALPERTLREEATDFCCEGEGLSTIDSLLQCDMSECTELKKVPGLWYYDEGNIAHSQKSEIISQENLPTQLPGMAWDLLPMDRYRASNWHCFDDINNRKPYASLYTSLGCPFKCSFCCINAPFGGSSFRYWDPNFMIKEFDILANEYGVKNVKIADEMFVLNERHFMTLSNLLIERNHNFNIWAYARVDTVKPKYLETLKKAGVNWLALGIESGSKHVRQGVTKGKFQSDDIKSVVRQIQNAGIRVVGNYIFGLPDDTYQSMQETLDLSLELNCEMSNYYSAMAYPGSALYTAAVKNNSDLPSDWLGYSQYSKNCKPLSTETLSSAEVLGFRDHAFDVYNKSENYLRSVKQKFGSETYEYIRDISKKKLERDNVIYP